MTQGPFPPRRLCCPPDRQYYGPLRFPPQPPDHFPVLPVIDPTSLPAARSGGALEGLPSCQDNPLTVPRPLRRRVHRRPLPDPRRLPWPSPPLKRLGTLSLPTQRARRYHDACSGFTTRCGPASRSTPLRRLRPHDRRRELRYQGPGRLPGPDSHRPAALTLRLGYGINLLSFLVPCARASGRTQRIPEGWDRGKPED